MTEEPMLSVGVSLLGDLTARVEAAEARVAELEAALRETITEWAAERGSEPNEYRHWEQVSTKEEGAK